MSYTYQIQLEENMKAFFYNWIMKIIIVQKMSFEKSKIIFRIFWQITWFLTNFRTKIILSQEPAFRPTVASCFFSVTVFTPDSLSEVLARSYSFHYFFNFESGLYAPAFVNNYSDVKWPKLQCVALKEYIYISILGIRSDVIFSWDISIVSWIILGN